MIPADPSEDGSESLTAELRHLEESLLDHVVRRDRRRLHELLADDFLEFGSSGRTWSKMTIIELLCRETYFIAPQIEDFGCAKLAEGVVLVTYKTERTDPRTGEVMASLRSSVWTRVGNRWRMRFHQGTRTPL